MTIPPPADRPLRWGVLATGRIAGSFATDLALLPDHELVAVGSRTVEAARAFAHRHGGPDVRAHGSYEALAADPDVDVVYVATPHGRHVEDVLTCLDGGKHVLCEKALALNRSDGQRLVDEARARGLFLAEAMWMRTNPNVRRLHDVVRSGDIGTVHQVRAELGFVASPDVTRLWDPALGASALLDVGIYPLTFAHLLLGEPATITATGVLSVRGIDVNGGATLTYPDGAVASIAWNQVARSDNRASVAGDAGLVEVPARFHHPAGFTLARGARPGEDDVEEVALPVLGRGYAHEAVEVAECLRAGRTESSLLPLDDTVSILGQMDTILEQLGVAAR